MSRKFHVFGPNETHVPNAAGSSIFCPPREPMLPPTNPTNEVPHQPPSSPIVFTSRIGARPFSTGFSLNSVLNCVWNSVFSSIFSTSANRSGWRGTRISLSSG